MLVVSIDQGEELFSPRRRTEAKPFLALLRDLSTTDAPAIIAVFTIRSDNYERLQLAPELEGVRQDTFSLPPMPKGSYAEVIKGPARRLERDATRARHRGRSGRCAADRYRGGRRQGRAAAARLHAGAALRRVPRWRHSQAGAL